MLTTDDNKRLKRYIATDPYLEPYQEAIGRRIALIRGTAERLANGQQPLIDFAAGHEYFDLHRRKEDWILREWTPNACVRSCTSCASRWRPQVGSIP